MSFNSVYQNGKTTSVVLEILCVKFRETGKLLLKVFLNFATLDFF